MGLPGLETWIRRTLGNAGDAASAAITAGLQAKIQQLLVELGAVAGTPLGPLRIGTTQVDVLTPYQAGGTGLTSGGSANVFGSWTQISASLAGPSMLTGIARDRLGAGTSGLKVVEIGVGPLNSEVAIARFKWQDDSSGNYPPIPCRPKVIANNARVSARLSDSGASGTISVGIVTELTPE